jgi:glucosamine 6-phosphate synthetase-like amidotransferase/phosphosugar isomerase protein
MGFTGTGLWADVQEVPGALNATLEAAAGVGEAAALLGGRDVARVVAVGNGAAYYVAHALWLASLESMAGGPPLVAVPCGVAVGERFGWRDGDAVLAISSSGEFREVVEIAQRGPARRCVALTADAGSSLAGAATTTVLQHVESQRAVTHTQALCGAYGIALLLWAAVTGDDGLAEVATAAPDAAARAIGAAEAWAPDALADRTPPAAAVAVGGGTAWAAALEFALMLKEIARVPAEGVETREGATSAMFGLDRGHLMVSLDPSGDPLGDEALALCAATGADTLQVPSLPGVDARLSPITTLPASAALAAHLALAGGHDVDQPTWTTAYEATARSAP